MDSRIIELAKQILANTNEVDGYLSCNNLPQPSFNVDGPVDFGIKSAEVEVSRLSAIESTMELQDLLLGPTMLLRPTVCITIPWGMFVHRPINGLLVQCDQSASYLQIRYRK